VNRHQHRFIYSIAVFAILVLHGCAPSVYESYYQALDHGKTDEVISSLTDTLATHPSAFEAQKILGLAWYQKNNFIAADSLLSLYLTHAPNDDQAMYYCAVSADSLNNDVKALEWYRMYVGIAAKGKPYTQADVRIRQLTQRRLQQDVRRSLFYEASLPAPFSCDTSTIAVLAFDNNGSDRGLDPLGRGLAEMMTTDLSKVRSVKVVERLRMQTILDELTLSEMNPSSLLIAPRAGRLSGAQRIIRGTFASTDDGMMHLDAAVTKTPDAAVEAYASAIEPKENIFTAEKKLVLELLRSLSIPVSADEREAILTVPTENYFAFVRYAQGLECADHGLYVQASAFFREAVNLDPHFTDAQDQLEYADALSGDPIHQGEAPHLPGGGTLTTTQNPVVPQLPGSGETLVDTQTPIAEPNTFDTDAITTARERAQSTLTLTTGGYAPGFGNPVKTNPVLIQHALPSPPNPPGK
jgi:tetratricopeptide (TPR) repeat protein